MVKDREWDLGRGFHHVTYWYVASLRGQSSLQYFSTSICTHSPSRSVGLGWIVISMWTAQGHPWLVQTAERPLRKSTFFLEVFLQWSALGLFPCPSGWMGERSKMFLAMESGSYHLDDCFWFQNDWMCSLGTLSIALSWSTPFSVTTRLLQWQLSDHASHEEIVFQIMFCSVLWLKYPFKYRWQKKTSRPPQSYIIWVGLTGQKNNPLERTDSSAKLRVCWERLIILL